MDGDDAQTKWDKAQRHYAAQMTTLRESLERPDDRILHWSDNQELIVLGRDCDKALRDLAAVDANLARLQADIQEAIDASVGA